MHSQTCIEAEMAFGVSIEAFFPGFGQLSANRQILFCHHGELIL